ncbi:hypothetical protein B4U79_17405 [Dinothrombium tinctorium]|uniref:EF-hand domain-containing protein n=1 Tax=Dinothrombium tinctorium TaxID=1965070 RepID=A0A3S3S4Y7_9ACAR|nr:hypothetical protein B4U79_17761 [Dinothrombium tinctorium]RWS09197.1 hypothetical protein B4U79_17709 [Dinothrombium tinctorium]RWS12906.1 hypothetical protein B4U79_17405 [Dinothrombium tinctorium]
MVDLIDEKQLRSSFEDAKDSYGKVSIGAFLDILKTHGVDPNDKIVTMILNEFEDAKEFDNDKLSLFFEHLEGKLDRDLNLRKVFNLIDADKDGFLDAHEIKEAFSMLKHPVSESKVRELMIEADTDKDGRISYNEFRFSNALKNYAADLL